MMVSGWWGEYCCRNYPRLLADAEILEISRLEFESKRSVGTKSVTHSEDSSPPTQLLLKTTYHGCHRTTQRDE